VEHIAELARSCHRPTVCTAWDVADIVRHMIGQAEDLLYPWRFFVRTWALDVVVLRDLWMHRDDICEATGRLSNR
jgi:hypothetical protein